MNTLSLLLGFATIALVTILFTSPSWLAGRIVGRKSTKYSAWITRGGRGPKAARWALVLVGGFIALSAGGAATGAFPWPVILMLVMLSLAAVIFSQFGAFAIGYAAASHRQQVKQLPAHLDWAGPSLAKV